MACHTHSSVGDFLGIVTKISWIYACRRQKLLKYYSIMTRRSRKSLEIVTNILSILARRRRKIWDFAIQKQGGMNPPSFEIFQNWGGIFQNWGGIPPRLHSTDIHTLEFN